MASRVVFVLWMLGCVNKVSSSPNNDFLGQTRQMHNPLERINVPAAQLLHEESIKITLDKIVLKHSGSWVTVSWSGVTDPQYQDWVALYVPADANPSVTAPSKFEWASDSHTHMINGSGSLRFKVINYHRQPGMRFAFLRSGLAAPKRVSVSEVLRFANPNEPVKGHLALSSDLTHMVIQWQSWNSTKPRVQWGTSPELFASEADLGSDPHHLSEVAGMRHVIGSRMKAFQMDAESVKVTKDEICGGTAALVGWVDMGQLHHASIKGLAPGQRYYYRYGDPVWGWSKINSFLAPPLPGRGYNWAKHPLRPVTPSSTNADRHDGGMSMGDVDGGAGDTTEKLFAGRETVRVLLTADMGQAEDDGANSVQQAMYASLNTTRWLAAEGSTFSLLLHAGDLAYSRGYSTQWDNFMTQIEPVASRMPYMVLPGNHERDWPASGDRFDDVMDSGGECGVMYSKRFLMPTQDHDLMWYSFDHGPVHFLTYSTEHITSPGSPQYDFIAKDLASVNRSVTPWLVVAGHRPMYVSSNNALPPDGDQLVATQLQEELEPLMIQHKVDLTFHGHHHTYQRTCPMIHGECVGYDEQGQALGPVHVIIGHGGAGLSMNVQSPPPSFIERIVLWWGYARMQASRSTLALEIISSLDGGLMDSLVLYKATP